MTIRFRSLEILLAEVVLGDDRVALPGHLARPAREPHVRLRRVGACGDDLGRRVTVRPPVHLVLHGGEEAMGGFDARVVVDARRVDVEHLPPEDLLRRADVADAREQLVEVVPATAPLQALVVEREALDDVLAEALRRPDTKLRAPVGLHAVADGDDHVEVELLDLALDLALALTLNHCRFCNGCRPAQLALVEAFLMCLEMTDLSRWNSSAL